MHRLVFAQPCFATSEIFKFGLHDLGWHVELFALLMATGISESEFLRHLLFFSAQHHIGICACRALVLSLGAALPSRARLAFSEFRTFSEADIA